MNEDTVDNSLVDPRAATNSRSATLDVVAERQSDGDGRRWRVLRDATHRHAALYEQKSTRHFQANSIDPQSAGRQTADDADPVWGAIAWVRGASVFGSPQFGQGEHAFRPPLHESVLNAALDDEFRGGTAGRERTIAAHSRVGGNDVAADPPALQRQTRAQLELSHHTADLSSPGKMHDRLVADHFHSLDQKLESVISRKSFAGRSDPLVKNHDGIRESLHDRAVNGNESAFREENGNTERRNQGPPTLRLAIQPPPAHERMPSEIAYGRAVDASAPGSIPDGSVRRINPQDRTNDGGSLRTRFNTGSGAHTSDGQFSSDDTNGSTQGALASATEEVERLAAALRRKVDELDRIQGSVPPGLPALPINRGSFRLS